jgi:peptidyl-prolyl cis-trans isomerase A (cyclophilin A)
MRLLPFVILLAATPLAAQAPPPVAPAAPVPAPTPAATVRVLLTTSAGPITVEVEKDRAPITAANFLRYVDQKRLDGASFYRAVKVQAGFGLVQGGVNNALKKVLPPIKHEPTTQTGLSHLDGTISMARNAPGTAQGEWFITVGDQKTMDANPANPGDNLGFAAFGHVVEGMDVVRAILDLPTSPTKGPPGMQGQMLEPEVRIVTARRMAATAATPPAASAATSLPLPRP